MINDYLSDHSRYASLLRFSLHFTVWLTIALLARVAWAKRPARAHRAMMLLTAAAVLSPAAALLVQGFGWGMLTANRSAALVDSQSTMRIDRSASETDLHPINERQPTDGVEPTEAVKIDAMSMATTANAHHHGLDSKVNPRSPSTRSDLLLVVWLIGSSVLAIRLVRSFAKCRSIVIDAQECRVSHCLNGLEDAMAQMSIKQGTNLLTSRQLGTPVIWCWSTQPTLLIPEKMANATLGRSAWRMIFCHELAHFLRRDHWCRLWSDLLVVSFPWHPLAWYARRELLVLQELACDDHVLHRADDAMAYAETLLTSASPMRCEAALAMAHRGTGVGRRINRILTVGGASPIAGRGWCAGLLALVILAITAGALAQTPVDGTAESPAPLRIGVDSRDPNAGMEKEVALARRALDNLLDEPLDLKASTGWQQTLYDYALEQAIARNSISVPDEPLAIRYFREVRTAANAAQAESVAMRAADAGLAGEWLGRIFAETAIVHAAHQNLRDTIAWAQTALRFPLSAHNRLHLFQLWRDAAAQINQQDNQIKDRHSAKVPLLLAVTEAATARREFADVESDIKGDANSELTLFAKWCLARQAKNEVRGTEVETDLLRVTLPEKARPFQRAQCLQGMRDLAVAFQLTASSSSTKQNPEWLRDRYAFSQTLPLDITRILPSVAQLVDDVAGDPGFVEDLLSSVKNDSAGPQVDLKRDIFAHFGNQITVIVNYANR
ncbi:MAG: M56 family metallopeptidase, partial [Planctomycetales bacterium]|nr:M56 family metallopeptidase [Planctomycetales bacterium]